MMETTARQRGGTPLYRAMIEASRLAAAGRHQKKVVIVITDGNNTG